MLVGAGTPFAKYPQGMIGLNGNVPNKLTPKRRLGTDLGTHGSNPSEQRNRTNNKLNPIHHQPLRLIHTIMETAIVAMAKSTAG